MDDRNLLYLLILDASEERAEQSISVLRNAGLVVRATRAGDAEQIQEALEEQTPDMILVSANDGPVTLKEVSALIGRGGKEIPIVALAGADEDQILHALADGAARTVLKDNPKHLQFVVKNELENIHTRRRVRLLEARNRENEKRADSLLDSSRDAIAYVHDGMHVYANHAYLENFGFEEFDEIEGMPILDMVTPETAQALKGVLRGIAKGEKPPRELETVSRRQSGDTFETTMEFSFARIEGEPCTQVTVRQRSNDPALAEELSDLRTRDLVTGLSNRQHFMDELDNAVNEALQGERDGTVLFIGVDDFRSVIRQVGVGGTDLILSDVAGVIKACVDDDSLAARFGDDSFTILNQSKSVDELEKLASRICADLEANISEVGKQSVTLTCSVGLTAVGGEVKSAQEALSHANDACTKAQQDGGNRVEVYNPAEHEDGTHAEDWLKAIKRALENDKFALVFQPIVSLHGVPGEFYEVLLRMESEDGNLVPPMDFLPIAEQNDLMGDIDRWVIEHAIRTLKQRNEDGHDTTFFVKLTPETVDDAALLSWISKQLKDNRVQGDKLVFEMPESRVVTHIKPTRRFVEGLKKLHCGFALEQFGSGLNSFQILKHLPTDYLKIDRTFIKDLAHTKDNREKVKQITEQAHANNKVTVAEFVEDAASMSVLWQFGVNFVQGNFLQEPEKVLAYDFN